MGGRDLWLRDFSYQYKSNRVQLREGLVMNSKIGHQVSYYEHFCECTAVVNIDRYQAEARHCRTSVKPYNMDDDNEVLEKF